MKRLALFCTVAIRKLYGMLGNEADDRSYYAGNHLLPCFCSELWLWIKQSSMLLFIHDSSFFLSIENFGRFYIRSDWEVVEQFSVETLALSMTMLRRTMLELILLFRLV